MARSLVVLDTQVVVSALIGRKDASSYRLLRAVGTGDIQLAISDGFLSELSRVIGYREIEPKIVSTARAFRVALDIGVMGEMHHPTRYDWPSIMDPDDGWMLDLAWASTADCIVTRDPHLTVPKLPFPVEVVEPSEMLRRITA